MAIALVGTIGTAKVSAAGSALTTLAWGTGETRATGNLLVLFVSVTEVATLPTTPSGGWAIAKQQAGTGSSATIYWMAAAGGDTAPTINAITSGVITGQLAEFSGVNVAAIDQSAAGTASSSPVTITFGGADAGSGELILFVTADYRSTARSPNDTWTSNHVTSVTQAGSNNGTSSKDHYSFAYGLTNSNSGADTGVAAFSVTTTLSGAALSAVTFKVGTPTSSLPTAGSLTMTGATPTVAVTNNVSVAPTAASLALTGATPSVLAPAVSNPTAASLTLTPATPTIAAIGSQSRQPTAASLTLVGATPTVAAGGSEAPAPSAASLALTGATPAVAAIGTAVSLPSGASLALSPATPAVTVSSGSPITVLPTAVSLALTGSVPAVVATSNVLVFPTPASLGLTGAVPTVSGGSPVSHGGGMPFRDTTRDQQMEEDELIALLVA
jgi:hypothetical protein